MKEWSNLAKIVYKRTYARKDTGTVENWKQTVERVIRGNISNIDPKFLLPNEAERLEYLMMNRKASPAGRGLWFSGAPAHAKLGGVALNNCWATTAEKWENFVTAQDLLMLGGGVGMSVEHRFTSRLSLVKSGVEIVHYPTKDADFIVPDSREGWCELTKRTLESLFVTGKSFSYSTVCVRGYGELISGFGGTASGPLPMIVFIEKVVQICKARAGKHLRPVDAMDIMCAIGEMVVAGNVRRSAIIILGDSWDKEYLQSKRWDLGGIPTQRAMANMSVVCDDIDDLHPLFWRTYEQGEPFGIVNRSNMQRFGRMGEHKVDAALLVNPCVPGDVKLWTKKGSRRIDSLVGQEIEIWNGLKWSCVVPKITGYNQPMVVVSLSNGATLRCTKAHKWITIDNSNEVKVRADQLQRFTRIKDWKRPEDLGDIVLQDLFKTSDIFVESVMDSGVEDVVYCFTDYENGFGVFNGIMTGQCAEATLENMEPCNLQEIVLSNLDSQDEFNEAARLMHRYGKRVTLERYHVPEAQAVVSRNRRVGTGITGCLGSPFFSPKPLDEAYKIIQEENINYSKELGIPESIRTTVVKPSGTIGKVMDSLEGVHPAFSQYMIQRIRFAGNDPLIPVLQAAGHPIEPEQRFDGSLNWNTMVVTFYVAWSDITPTGENTTTWQQLDTLLMAQKYWADQAVSITVYYKKEEIPLLKEWLANNLKNLKSISFLLWQDHGFVQAPKESISKEEYEKKSSLILSIDDNVLMGGSLESMECEGGACPVK